MTKQVFWAVVAAIVVGELLFLFLVTLPSMSAVSEAKETLQRKMEELSRYNRKDVPVPEEAKMHRENRKRLREGYIALIEQISQWEKKRWERWLKRGKSGFEASDERPSVGDFRTLYTDAMEELEARCRKVKLTLAGEEGDEIKPYETELMREWQQEERFEEPGASPPSEEIPPSNRDKHAFWVAVVPQINQKNMPRAQKEYWIQQTIVKALLDAEATRLLGVRIVWKRPTRWRRYREEERPKTEIDRLFDKVYIYVFAHMPYRSVGKFVESMLRWNDPDNYLLMRLARLEVRKEAVEEITIPDPRALARIPPSRSEVLQILMGKSWRLTSADLRGVFPVILQRAGEAFDLGAIDPKKLSRLLPRQEELLAEPSVVVAAKFVLYDLKDDAVESTKKLGQRKPKRSGRRRR